MPSLYPELIAYPKNYPSTCDTWLWSQFLLCWKTKQTYIPKSNHPQPNQTNKKIIQISFKGKGDKKRLNLHNSEICSFFKFTQWGQIRAPNEMIWTGRTHQCLPWPPWLAQMPSCEQWHPWGTLTMWWVCHPL